MDLHCFIPGLSKDKDDYMVLSTNSTTHYLQKTLGKVTLTQMKYLMNWHQQPLKACKAASITGRGLKVINELNVINPNNYFLNNDGWLNKQLLCCLFYTLINFYDL